VAFFGLGDVGGAEVVGVDGFLGVGDFLLVGEGEPALGAVPGIRDHRPVVVSFEVKQ